MSSPFRLGLPVLLAVPVLLLLLSAPAGSAQSMTMMQKARHVSPLPGLMMVVKNDAAALGLSERQSRLLREWRDDNHEESQRLTKRILEIEQQMRVAALNGGPADALMDLRNALLQARGKLIDVKYACIAVLRRTLDERQWQQLMELHRRNQRAAASAPAGNEIQAFLRVSPMPKFMMIVIMHAAELGLSAEQEKALEAWRMEHMHNWAALLDEVILEERALTDDAIGLSAADGLMARYDVLLQKRRRMAVMSLACRDNMRSVLSDRQWAQLVDRFAQFRD